MKVEQISRINGMLRRHREVIRASRKTSRKKIAVSLLMAEADAIGTAKNNRSYAERFFPTRSENLSGMSSAGLFGKSS